MDISELLAFAVKNKASDLHLSAGLPPMIRVHGDVRRINLPPMEHSEVHAMIYDIMNDGQRKAWVADSVREAAIKVASNIRGIMSRLDARQAAVGTMGYAMSSAEAMNEVLGTTAALIDDNKAVAVSLCSVADVGWLLAQSLDDAAVLVGLDDHAARARVG